MATDSAESAQTDARTFQELLSELARETAEHGAAPQERALDEESDLLEGPQGAQRSSTLRN